MTLPIRVITYAWGDSYIDELLSLTIPALLAPGNLPSLVSQVSCEVVILTEERLFPRVSSNGAIMRLRAICPLKLIGLDDLITSPDKKYGMALTYALHRGFADLGPAITDHWLIFLNADFLLADGSLRNLLDHLMRGERLVAAPSYCVVARDVKVELLKRVDPNTKTLSIAPRDMAEIALRHRHNTIRGKTVHQQAFHIVYMEQFYRLLNEKTLLGYQMPVAIVGMRPERHVEEPNSYWDHGLMKEFCPTAKPDVIGDSDEFLMIELREKDVAQDQIQTGWPEPRELSERMISWVTPYQRDFAAYPLTLHVDDLPANIDDERRTLRSFVDEVLSYLPRHLPSHLEHPQWTYHWPGFMEARHRFLSSRLGSLTETLEPPDELLATDRTWWKLDGKRKSLTRRRAESAGAAARVQKVIQDAMRHADQEYEKRRQELDSQLLLEIERSAIGLQSNQECFAHIAFSQEPGVTPRPESDELSLPRGKWVALLKRYLEEYTKLQPRLQEKIWGLQQALDAINNPDLKQTRSVDQELERVDAEYLLLIRKPAHLVSTSFLRMRRGPVIHKDTRIGLRWLARKLYYWFFGKWPRVSKLSPYWAALRHLRQLAESAAERGAKDMLIIGDCFGVAQGIVDLPGLYAWMSVAGLMTGSTGGTFAQPPQFDICVCDLELGDLTRLSEIFSAVRQFMRPGGTIIGFHLNVDAVRLTIGDINENLRNTSVVRIYHGGSERSSNVLRAFRSALSLPRSTRILFLGKLTIRVGLISASAWLGNMFEALFSSPQRPNPLATSVTIDIRLPEFEGDDGTVTYAKLGGIYVDQVEALVAEDRSVPLSAANPRGTTAILTFGQSNAASSGEERYAAREAVHVFNTFDMKFYRAIDPLPRASTDGGSVWGRLGDKLIAAGAARSVLIIPIAFGATYVEDWAPGGQLYRRLLFALHRLKWVGVEIDMLCWHQGEANANYTRMTADEYCAHFRSMLRGLRQAGVNAPVYVALATLCEDAPHPFQNCAQIRLGQKRLVCIRDGILPGPDTDRIGIEHRRDGCHFSASGQELAAQAWYQAITAGRLRKRMVSAKYRIQGLLARGETKTGDESARGPA